MSVPGQAAPEGPWAPPPSPRGNCCASDACGAPLACSALPPLSSPWPEGCSSIQACRTQGSHLVSWDVAKFAGEEHVS